MSQGKEYCLINLSAKVERQRGIEVVEKVWKKGDDCLSCKWLNFRKLGPGRGTAYECKVLESFERLGPRDCPGFEKMKDALQFDREWDAEQGEQNEINGL